ncbi:MAG: ribbon-helix-helix protein, CopG family [Erysipelotrichaceae bacterium]|nr:ribbon-helix-helix protein, CopG family [Erysipelotrichaceae bacterium]
MPEKKKMGRPIIGKPKSIRLEISLDEETSNKLNNLCEQKKISRAELIRQLIKKAK